MMTLVLILITIAWATWLFSGVSLAKELKSKLTLLLVLIVVSSLAAYSHYQSLGSHQKIHSLVESHQVLKDLSLLQLSEKIEKKEIDLEQLLAELRLRSEAKPNDPQQWLKLGNIFLQFEQYSQSEQAYQRAININQDNKLRLQVARSYMDHGTEDASNKAQEHINLVLLENPTHEGALLLQGINSFQQANFQQAVNYWKQLLSLREAGGEGAKIIQQQIELAQQKIAQLENNRITLIIDKLENIPLQSFTKAFALVRPAAGGVPLAVKSIEKSELNQPIYITPDNLMLTDMDLWQVTDIKVEIRLSVSGFAKPEVGDIFGSSQILTHLKQGESYHISLNQSVK